jgi:hypothetical protein
MAFLSIAGGNANAMIERMEDYFSIASTKIRRAGTLAALTSPRNTQSEFQPIEAARDPRLGHRKEWLLRYKSDPYCGEDALNSADSKALDACDNTNGIDAPAFSTVSIEYGDGSAFTGYGRKTVYDLPTINNQWDNTFADETARLRAQAIEDIVTRQLNPALFAALQTGAGGYLNPDDETVTAAGTAKLFEVLNPKGAVLDNFWDEFTRLMRWNGMDDAPFVIHGDSSFYSFTRKLAREMGLNAFTANDDGVDLGALANALEYEPYLDNTAQLFTAVTKEEALLMEPGAARLFAVQDFVGDMAIDSPLYKKITFTGPFGIPFDLEWKYHDCGDLKGKVVEVIRCQVRLFVKPTTVNQCELSGTNGIIKATFNRCAPEAC